MHFDDVKNQPKWNCFRVKFKERQWYAADFLTKNLEVTKRNSTHLTPLGSVISLSLSLSGFASI